MGCQDLNRQFIRQDISAHALQRHPKYLGKLNHIVLGLSQSGSQLSKWAQCVSLAYPTIETPKKTRSSDSWLRLLERLQPLNGVILKAGRTIFLMGFVCFWVLPRSRYNAHLRVWRQARLSNLSWVATQQLANWALSGCFPFQKYLRKGGRVQSAERSPILVVQWLPFSPFFWWLPH